MKTTSLTPVSRKLQGSKRPRKRSNDQSHRQVLRRQFKSLKRLVHIWKERSPARVDSQQPDEGPITRLLDDFKAFFTDYHTYFERRIKAGDITKDRAILTLRRVNCTMQEQWTTLSRMLAQRRSGSPYRARLLDADLRAAAYYERFTGAKPGNAQPLVYIEKLYNISRFPYQPVPLIAIPLADWDRQENWLPLAHEMGHFVFWNSANLELYQDVQKRFRDAVESQAKESFRPTSDYPQAVIDDAIQTWQRWLEESFAELFGALVAGPAYAQNAQDRLVRDVLSQADDLLSDDGEHPMPAVRPLLSAHALKHLKGGKAASTLLINRWQPYLERALAVFKQQAKDNPDAAPNRPSPELLAKMAPTIVEILFTTPALQGPASSELDSSLSDLVTLTWQPQPEWGEVSLAEFAPPKLPNPSLLLKEASSVTSKSPKTTHQEDYESSFQKLVDFVRIQIQDKIKTGQESEDEWDVILASGRAIISYVQRYQLEIDPGDYEIHQGPYVGWGTKKRHSHTFTGEHYHSGNYIYYNR